MTEMFGEAWSPMSVPDLAPDDDERKDYFALNMIYEQKMITSVGIRIFFFMT